MKRQRDEWERVEREGRRALGARACVLWPLGAVWLVFAWTGSLAAQVTTELADREGFALFQQHCSRCHGVDGRGGEGPTLATARLPRAQTDEELAMVIARGIPDGGMPRNSHLSEDDTSAIVSFVRSLSRIEQEPLTGDPARGAEVFLDHSCDACHIVDGRGIHVGPELTDIGLKRSASHLKESVLEPNAAVPTGYEFLRARAKDGDPVEGLLVNEDTFTIQLREANGLLRSYEKSDLDGLQRMTRRSIMRAYKGRMSPAELDDLIAYLATRRGSDEAEATSTSEEEKP